MKTKLTRPSSLLEALIALSPDSSKTTLRSWLEHERVFVDGKVVKRADTQLIKGQEVEVGKKGQVIQQKVKILFEDSHLVVVEKPEGLLTVATDHVRSSNLHTILKDRVHPRRVYPVHRLDRETSGIIVFAYTEKAKDGLKKQFFHHTLDREYLGWLEGKLETSKGTWRSFLKEDQNYRVHSNPHEGQEAITHYEVVKHTRSLTWVKFKLETGRKNQIRVHCQDAGHPIFGDEKYGSTLPGFARMYLHACRLGFVHPETGKKLNFESRIPF